MGLWCIVPAAGSGSRMGAPVPKQYLDLAGRPLLCWTLEALEMLEPEALLLVVAPDDTRVRTLPWMPDRAEVLARGGASRAESVLAGLDALAGRAEADDWVLVHDAARPCVDVERVTALLAAVASHPDGGLLAEPVTETVKHSEDGVRVSGTLARDGLWLAQTPQVFRHGALTAALRGALDEGVEITDEASAIEHAGGRPLLVPSSRANLKVTRQADLALAASLLERARLRAGNGK